ncbi:thioredoxin-dependent thiol peroxidase [Bacteroidia bacterium]|nr:thioredoxin-dependent thiol peroxidase [Bacteroidia bacterium]
MSTIKKGDNAPQFQGKNQKGETISLATYAGKKLVLYFYPKDDTPGCTAEACDLRDNYDRFIQEGYAILGVSPDDEKKHQKFIDKYDLPFDLLADTEKETCEMYGVWVKKSMYGREYMGVARTTFVINEDGTIEDVIEKVKTKEHTNQILN